MTILDEGISHMEDRLVLATFHRILQGSGQSNPALTYEAAPPDNPSSGRANALLRCLWLKNLPRRGIIAVRRWTGAAERHGQTAITKADTMLIVVSDDTQDSWWVPWEIGVSTPLGTPKAMYKPQAKSNSQHTSRRYQGYGTTRG